MKTSTLLISIATLALANANVAAVKNAPLNARDASSLEARNFCTDTTCNSSVKLPEALTVGDAADVSASSAFSRDLVSLWLGFVPMSLVYVSCYDLSATKTKTNVT
jgi:hypothetical protein